MPQLIRRTRCCVLGFEGTSLSGSSFMVRQPTMLDDIDLAIMAALDDWQDADLACAALRTRHGHENVIARIDRLFAAGLIVAIGTRLGAIDIEFETRFAWGPTAASYHFGIKDPVYMTPAQMSDWLVARVEAAPRVPLFTTNEAYAQVTALRTNPDSALQSLQRRRRSWRGFSSQPMPLQALADCLFAGLGITGFVGTLTPGEGRLPIGMTPSGGGRNPYEAYVYVRHVETLVPGVYHYSAVEHSLGLVNENSAPTVGEVLAGQPWFDGAAALVILVAHFDRTMWKYPHPTGYRVVLLEAGHIAQNILLAATDHGLAAAPTCAVSDETINNLIGLNSILTSPIYTIGLGLRSGERSQADIIEESPNPLLAAAETARSP